MRSIKRALQTSEEMFLGAGPEIGFGAKRVGVLLDRLRLHLETDRFLAERRRDPVWEVGCDYAVLALGRLASRLRPSVREASLVSEVAALKYGAARHLMSLCENSNLGRAARRSGGHPLDSKDATLKGGATQTSGGRVLTRTLMKQSGRLGRSCRVLNPRKPTRSLPLARSARR